MSKKSDSVVTTVNVNTGAEAVAPEATYADICALVPAKEHRTFTEADLAAAKLLKFPESAKEIAATTKGLPAGVVFALCVLAGKAGCGAVAKAILADDTIILKPSASASFKSVDKGMTEFFAGKTAYGLLSMGKNS